MIGFVEILQLVTTSKDYALTVLHTSQITIIHTRFSQSVTVLTSRCLVATPNNERFPSSGFPNCPRPQLPASNSNSSQQLNSSGYLIHYLTNQLFANSTDDWTHFLLTVLLITSGHGSHRKLFADCCLVTAVVYVFVSLSLPRCRSTHHNMLPPTILTH
jgi:hypothetical protein